MGGFFQPANSQQVVGYLTIFRVLSKARIIIFCGNETTHYQSGKIKKTTKGMRWNRLTQIANKDIVGFFRVSNSCKTSQAIGFAHDFRVAFSFALWKP